MNPKNLFFAARLIMAWAILFVSHLALAGDIYEVDDTAAAAKAISNGQVQVRSIHFAGDVDWAKFTVGANGANNVVIETAGSYGDTEMWLYGPNGSTVLLAYDDDGNGLCSRISLVTLAAGTYYIRVQEYGNNAIIPVYTLRASWTDRVDGNNTAATATPITSDQKVPASIAPVGDIDWYRFTVGAYGATNAVIETSGSVGATEMWLYGPNNSTAQLAYNGTSAFSRISKTSLVSGTYYIKVQEYGNNATIAAYTLKASWTNRTLENNTADTATPVANGQTIAAAITPVGDIDWYKFTVGSAGATDFEILTAGSTGDPVMWIYGPNSSTTQVDYADDGNGSFPRYILTYLAAGTYYVKFQDYGNNEIIPDYTFRVGWTNIGAPGSDGNNTPLTATSLTNGVTASGAISPVVDVDWYKFTVGSTGATNVEILAAGLTGDPVMTIYGPDSSTTRLDYVDDGNGSFPRYISTYLAPGTYYLKFEDYGNNSTLPSYTLRAFWTPIGSITDDGNNSYEKATPLINGQTVTMAINPVVDVDWYKFVIGSTGATNVLIECAGSLGDPFMTIYGPTNIGTVFAGVDQGNGNFPRYTTTYLPPGTYYLKLEDYGNNDTIPAFTMKAVWTNGAAGADGNNSAGTATPITNGVTVSAAISPMVDVDWYKFTVGANGATNVVIDANGSVGDPSLAIYGPNNATSSAGSADDGNGNFPHFTTNYLAPGTYYIQFHQNGENLVIPSYTLKATWTNK